jgi:hypothetical protein
MPTFRCETVPDLSFGRVKFKDGVFETRSMVYANLCRNNPRYAHLIVEVGNESAQKPVPRAPSVVTGTVTSGSFSSPAETQGPPAPPVPAEVVSSPAETVPVPTKKPTKTQVQRMPLRELQDLAKKHGIDPHGHSRTELIEVLKKALFS